jgi:hypothetical protein
MACAGQEQCFSGIARVVRMEQSLCRDLWSGNRIVVGHVGHIYRNGFDLVMKSGRFIHFQNGDCLLSPFSAILDHSIHAWMGSVSLRLNDVILKKGEILFRKDYRDPLIHLGWADTLDLQRPTLCLVADEAINRWILLLSNIVSAVGHLDGVGGSLILLPGEVSGQLLINPSLTLNRWGRQAVSVLRACLDGLCRGEKESFMALWDGLLGLGPGLTTSGDDFLVGFLSVHHFLCSPLCSLLDSEINSSLRRRARIRTNDVGFQFLDCALKGLFSENIHHLFRRLNDRTDDEATRRYVTDFIRWGYSSGTDIATGIIFGLVTLLKKERKRSVFPTISN